jgi:chromosome segregation ATPase
MTYKAELDAAVAANEKLTAEINAALESRDSLASELEKNTGIYTAVSASLEQRTAELEAAQAEIATLRELVNAAEAKVADFNASVARAAQDALAQTGCDPLAVDPNSEPAQVSSEFEQRMQELQRLQKTDPAAATKYFREHKAALYAAKQ